MIGRLARLLSALPSSRRREIVALLTVMLAAAVVDGATILSVSTFLKSIGGISNSGIQQSAAELVSIFLLSGLLRLGVAYGTQHVGQFSSRDLILQAHRNWIDQPYANHLQRHSARLLATPERIDQAVFGLLLPTLQALAAVLTTGCIVGALVMVDATSALLMLTVLLLLFGAVGLATGNALSRKAKQANLGYEMRVKIMQESHGAIREIILDGAQGIQSDRLRAAANQVAAAAIAQATISSLPRQLIEIVGIFALAFLALYLAQGPGGLAAAFPILGALALAGQRLLPAAQSLFQTWAGVTLVAPMVDDALALAQAPTPIRALSAAIPALRESIDLKDLAFCYPGLTQKAVDGVTLRIAKGERITIVGPSGAGKSTLADLLMGLLEPNRGSILLDGVDCNAVALRTIVSHVPQSPYFVDQSLANAIVGTQIFDDERLSRTIEAAALEDLVMRAPNGIHTWLGEDGVRWSGGERQRIALARAIYREAPLLILDEATSAIDDDAEQHILDSLDRIQAQGTTIIIIAHRGGALCRAGRMVRLENGKISSVSAQIAPRFEHQD